MDIHKIIEDYLKGTITELPVNVLKYKAWFDMLREFDLSIEDELAVLEGWVPCDFDDKKAWLKAKLDLKVLRSDKAWVFDWKTGKVYPDHIDQKEVYAILVFLKHPEVDEIESWHVYVDLNNKDSKKIYHRSELPALIAKWNGKIAPLYQALERYKEDEAETFFVTNPSYLCDYCPFSKNPCPH